MAQVAILVPTMRAHRLPDVVTSIQESTSDYRIVVMATGDCADAARKLPVDLIEDAGGTWPQRINRGFRATNEQYIFTGADDLKFHLGWFEAAMITMNQFPNGLGVVAVNDRHNRAGVHFLIARGYSTTFRSVLDAPENLVCENYFHSYCDDELRSTALFHNRFAYCEHSTVEHMHPGCGKGEMDAIYSLGESTMAAGYATYRERAHLWQDPA